MIRNPNWDKELSTKNYIDKELDKNTILRFNQTLGNYFEVSVEKNTQNLMKCDKMQTADTIESKFPDIGSYLLQNWNIKFNNKN